MKTFKTEFHPTAQQQEYIRKACGIHRWTWNWAVATYFEEAKKDNFLQSYDLQKMSLSLDGDYNTAKVAETDTEG